MSAIPETFRAFIVDGDDGGRVRVLPTNQLGEDDVTIAVSMSSINFKDGLASRGPTGKVARISPLIPGIDLAGRVAKSNSAEFAVGDRVLVHGYDLGVAHHGGFSELARVPAEWVVRMPESMSDEAAMSFGTAGFTAALSVIALEEHGTTPNDGPVLVTGATGGVGSTAVALLADRGFEVVASSGKSAAGEWLRSLGAAEVLDRSETSEAAKPLQRERWAGAVDCVGGTTLAYVLSSLRYGAAVAASGNTGGVALPTTVFPFILRGTTLIGIDSVQCAIARRQQVWDRLASDLRPSALDTIGTRTIGMDELRGALASILAGESTGRTLVRVSAQN